MQDSSRVGMPVDGGDNNEGELRSVEETLTGANQKGIQEVCEGLANKIDLLAQRTQALEMQAEQLKEAAEKSSREIEKLKAKNKQGAERLES
ncbi:hypothetical protein NDU88_003325 [Pleurodeles waltl]|uniref:Uncharacterized protein n=1 Tax=Pleurodeles waltl TaxID=8319 RepID=A0AAV7RE10_PLEWA|nr:hypothetical protein NDU88_003325 [Pleurodeles waltl]